MFVFIHHACNNKECEIDVLICKMQNASLTKYLPFFVLIVLPAIIMQSKLIGEVLVGGAAIELTASPANGEIFS
jgi:hypothetical protein